jgi:hypothetical protein
MSGVKVVVGGRRRLGRLLAIVSTAFAAPAIAARDLPTFVLPPALPAGGHYSPLGALHIQRQLVSAWVFEAPGSVPEIMSWLSARQPALRDLWITPGVAVLAGFADGMHWAARLSDTGGGRTRGTISVLPMKQDPESVGNGDVRRGFPTHGPTAMPARRADAPQTKAPWRLKGAGLRFEVRSRDEGAEIVEQIWTHGAPPRDLGRMLARDLMADGWRQSETPAFASVQGSGQWSRGPMSLSVVIVPLDGGSGVTTILRIGD